MRATLAVLALASSAAAQAVTQLIVPSSTSQPGCDNSRTGSFNLVIVAANGTSGSSAPATPAPTKRSAEEDIVRRQNANGHLELTLTGGILKDSNGRQGYIASNYQFQFDGPPQAGAIYTAGWGICPNGSLALGGQSVFWSCKSGAFSNLYDRNFAPVHCSPVLFYASDGRQDGYSTAPPGPEMTGGDQATIPNAGGTQLVNSTATPTTSATTGGAAGNATMTSGSFTIVAGSSASQSGPSSTQTAQPNAASNAAAAVAASRMQMILAWAVGVVGVAVAL